MVRARVCGLLTVAVIASVISAAGAARAETVPAPVPSGGFVDQPALPGGGPFTIDPSVPEGTFDPMPTEPWPTAVSTVPPEAPVGTFEWSHPAETAMPYFPSRGGTTTYRGTDGEVPQDVDPAAPQGVEPVEEPAETVTASPSPMVPTASPSPTAAREGSGEPGTAEPTSSAQRSPVPGVPGLIIGILLLVAGVAIVGYRGPVYAAAARAEARLFAKGSADRARRLRSPLPVAVVGAFAVLTGVVMMVYALWGFSI